MRLGYRQRFYRNPTPIKPLLNAILKMGLRIWFLKMGNPTQIWVFEWDFFNYYKVNCFIFFFVIQFTPFLSTTESEF